MGFAGFQEKGAERRTQRESVERGKDHRDGDCHRELLIQPSRDAGNEGRRDKHSSQNKSDGDDRAGYFLHGLDGSIVRR